MLATTEDLSKKQKDLNEKGSFQVDNRLPQAMLGKFLKAKMLQRKRFSRQLSNYTST